jgi:hypothetical protein
LVSRICQHIDEKIGKNWTTDGVHNAAQMLLEEKNTLSNEITDLRRMDIIVDFGREQFIIELKLWRGEFKHQDAYEQLLGYMDSKNAGVGYLLTFDLRKSGNKNPQAEWMEFGKKRIYDVVV